MGQQKGKKQVVVYLPPELHQSLRLQSARTGKSMSELVEQALKSRTGSERRLEPLPDHPELPTSEVVDALAKYGAPLWSSGRPTQLSLEDAIARGLALARQHASLMRVLPVVLYKNRMQVSWQELRARVADPALPALGMLLDLTAEVTGAETFRAWASWLEDARPRQQPMVPFFETKARGGRYLELARRRTPDIVRKWGFVMATPIDDFRSAVTRFCQDLKNSTAPT